MTPDDLPPPTVPTDFQVSLRGFQDEAQARYVGDVVGRYLTEFSRFIDAERLDGVTIAYDYVDALASLDRGVEGLRPLSPSTEHAIGVAMAPMVLRQGAIKGHLVIDARLTEALLDEKHELHQATVYTLAHELGHISDLKKKDLAFPGKLLRTKYANHFDGYLFQMVDACWDEYAASRLSANFWLEQVRNYEETFVSTLSRAKTETDREIAAFRYHGDVSKLLHVAILHHGNLMKFAAYLIGHLHGMEGSPTSNAPAAATALAGSYFQETFAELEAVLSVMWQSYGTWAGVDIYDDLKKVCWTCLQRAGLVLRSIEDGGLYIDVP